MFETTNQDITIIKIRYDMKIMKIYEGMYIMSENGEARQMAVSVFNAKMMIKPWLLGVFAPTNLLTSKTGRTLHQQQYGT